MTDQSDMTEAQITINGHGLTAGQAMTVRCALNSFGASLVEDGLGSDEHGKAMTEGYLARIREIREMMQK